MVAWNQGELAADQAVVYLFRADHQAKGLVEAAGTDTDRQGGVEMLTPASLEVQILVNLKEVKIFQPG